MPEPSPRWTIIDGNNLIHADAALSETRRQDFQTARQVLVRRLETVCGGAGARMTVVFDSTTPKPVTGFEGSPLEVLFAEPGLGADALIERMVHDAPDPSRITVVTSDAVERRVVEAAGAMSQSCRLFLQQFALDREGMKGRVQRAEGAPFKPRLGDVWR
jgi:predicted RNA-binding protein with PIN domain